MAQLDTDAALALKHEIVHFGSEFGFAALAIASIDLESAGARLREWLAAGLHGQMAYMARHGSRRWRPTELVPGTACAICVRLEYWPAAAADPLAVLADPARAYIARYALGRDYHKLLRPRLQKLADRIAARIGDFGYRVFVDSAPVMEKPLAANAGLGWIGKHTNLIAREAGSWFFLGEIYTDLPLPPDAPVADLCGSCRRCLDACPTGALPAPYRIDARRCISYLTIEHHGPIDPALRPLIGNRIYGCDDCQLVCPWNRYARVTAEPDFRARHGLDAAGLVELFAWDESTYLTHTEGSALRRVGYLRWLRNLAIALGNAPADAAVIAALQARAGHSDAVVRDAVQWALARQHDRKPRAPVPSALDFRDRARLPRA
ncbi:MAG: tRNA epoxyqueuosine(34) reductase QueG [Xanthomonadales bacterium]|nr:Epoxyqueuosine reductase [Xanthomonadales bacterium]MCC6592843.1 tRNA epoxyqueuosine(34) reductase QueG [Xanthomonadales bacterium]MCE7930529.1 tRNA epoxyqueuosine(34) reductase QueG [Xanthomonadales bacterium PRO6]